MATCCICNYKIGIVERDAPLSPSPSHQYHKICSSCNVEMMSAQEGNREGFLYLEQYIQQIEDPIVLNYLQPLMAQAPVDHDAILQEKIGALMHTSGYNFEGYVITQYLGFISSEAALGAGLSKGIVSTIGDMLLDSPRAFKNKMLDARTMAFDDLRLQAATAGANAIIGLKQEFAMFGQIVAVVLSGTAVTIEPIE